MIALSPGKIVISGAYSVLAGAPAISLAVDRYVRADGSRAAAIVTDEVRCAVEAGAIARAPWFDASALRRSVPGGSEKLGLGSSAAILVASLASVMSEAIVTEDELRARVFEAALAAHRKAQGGGSGVDVATSVFGGGVACRSAGERLEVLPYALPDGIFLEIFASSTPASTRDLLGRVRALEARDPEAHRRIFARARAGAEEAVIARSDKAFIAAIDAQFAALSDLGRAAAAPIVTPEMQILSEEARHRGAAFGPAGAGGGDVAIFVGPAPPSGAFTAHAADLGLAHLPATTGVRGVHLERAT